MPEGFPPSATELIGREDEIAALRALLGAGRTRLLTLTGPGGSGKTRLAVETALLLHPHYPDGVRLVELSAGADPAHVPHAVAAALGLEHRSAPSVEEVLRAALARRRRRS